jgi:hypothetical protein
MDMEEMLALCAGMEGAQEAHPFGPYPICFRAGGRIFAQVYPDKVTLRCDRAMGERWRAERPGVVARGYHCPPAQAPYFVTVPLEGGVADGLRPTRTRRACFWREIN